MTLMLVVGCIGSEPVDHPVARVTNNTTIGFECLNTGNLHVVSCQGSISLFPITVTIEHLHILSGNDLTILSDDLNDVGNANGSELDHGKIRDDVEAAVIDDFLNKLDSEVTSNDVLVCTAVLGIPICQ
jgi:hypothetical protein